MSTKEIKYQEAAQELRAILEPETNMITIMSTICSVLKHKFDNFFWIGFYCMHKGALIVGPYQGTQACLHITLQKGVCGRAAREGKTQIVDDVHADPQHIACDPRSQSEIVIPVRDKQGALLAVLDVDSTDLASFDELDQKYLEEIINWHFAQKDLEFTYLYQELV